jgi:nucleotide-binding universal stress UspA family protein
MELKRVLVGVDFSHTSLAAVRWVGSHLAAGGEVFLVHAVELPQAPSFLRRVLPAPTEVEDELKSAARHRLTELAGSVGLPDGAAHVRTGSAPQVLAELARELEIDLIVVGEHGGRRGARGLLGTTAERLLNVSPRPVLIARDMPPAPVRAVLAALDGSATDARVLRWSRLFHELYGAEVTACHAVDIMELYGRVRTISAAARLKEMETQLRDDARRWIRECLTEAGLPGDERHADVRMGDARYAIPGMAESAGADLIVMGGRGAGAVSRVVVGSVTSAILSATSFPVLVVLGEDRGP